MKIIVMLSSFSAGGSERVAIDVANELVRKKHDVTIFAIRAVGEYKAQVDSRVTLHHSSSSRAAGSVQSLAGAIRQFSPDFIFTSQYYLIALAYMARVASGRQQLKIIGREATTPSAENYTTLKSRCLRMLIKYIYQRVDVLISPCEFVKKDVMHFYQLSREVQVLYNPLNVDDIQTKGACEVTHPWFETPIDDAIVVSVGRLHEVKNFPFLIESFSKLNALIPSRLLILGEGEQRKLLEGLIKKLKLTGRVSMPGFADNPFAYMAKADVLALTSKFEGYPNVLLQAMILGTPSVAVDCPGGIKEILKDECISAINDSDAFAKKLSAIIEGSKDGGIYQQEKNYNNVSGFVDRLISLYRSVS